METGTTALERLLTSEVVAPQFGVTERTMREWRAKGVGPPYVRIGGGKFVRYKASDVAAYIARLESHAGGAA